MKKIYYTALAIGVLATSCAKEEVSHTTEAQEIKKEVKAEVINGETTVTITTTKNGETNTETLTGVEAELFLEKDHLNSQDVPEGAKVIIKKLDHNSEVNLNIDEILNDPELANLNEETKEKIKIAIENSIGDIDHEMESTEKISGSKVTTKVVVIDEK